MVAATADGGVGDDRSEDGAEAITQEPQPPPVVEVLRYRSFHYLRVRSHAVVESVFCGDLSV